MPQIRCHVTPGSEASNNFLGERATVIGTRWRREGPPQVVVHRERSLATASTISGKREHCRGAGRRRTSRASTATRTILAWTRYNLIRKWDATDAAVHDRQTGRCAARSDTGKEVWADSPYRSVEIEARLKANLPSIVNSYHRVPLAIVLELTEVVSWLESVIRSLLGWKPLIVTAPMKPGVVCSNTKEL